LKLKISNKNALSNKLIGFLPFLKSSFEEIDEIVKNVEKENPLINVRYKKFITFSNYIHNSTSDIIENRLLNKNSLYEDLKNQIEASNFFPTSKSKQIALKIIEDITNEGFFEGDEEIIAKELNIKKEEVEKVRNRFYLLEPTGVGAKDMKECFLFQLYNLDISPKLYNLVYEMIINFEHIEKYQNEKYFKEALSIIQQFNIIPSLNYIDSEYIIPDIIVLNQNGNLEIKLNEDYYPEIEIKNTKNLDKFAKEKLKEAKSLIEALELRKSTLYKIALMIVELQYDFFMGGVIKPMKLQDVADELGYALSTISRAISNKYILCDRGIIPIKHFFSKALDENVSSREIQKYIQTLIKNEDKNKPLNDEKLTEEVKKKFNIKIVRRTISKYRENLNIPTSRQRKRNYKLLKE
jgi:RNA polymerase sigma-54 factor